jgi:hypothetical protein
VGAEPTLHDELVKLIASFADDPTLDFDQKADQISAWTLQLTDEDLRTLLAQAGFIPEVYEHDSSEEKVYAKAMDVLVAAALERTGYDATVSAERSNAADVTAIFSRGAAHEIVLDAKAFRLSRTALNPKDYKIEALNTWRKGADFACLVAPLAGFPLGSSRLFREAVRFNVTLLTFSHLAFLLEHKPPAGTDGDEDPLWPVWTVAQALGEDAEPSAEEYWAELDRAFCSAIEVELITWTERRQDYFDELLRVADQQIDFFQDALTQMEKMPREQLLDLAKKALKIDGKIKAIEVKKRMARRLLESIEDLEEP